MRTRSIWRIAAMVAGILACGGLALGACMAKRAEHKGGASTGVGQSVRREPVRPPLGEKPPGADAGTEIRRPAPRPNGMEVRTKSNKGMVGQMRLEGGE
jgi:hypothetical protein